MLCYKDRTYCVSKCATECKIKVTLELEKEADNFGLPLSVADYHCESFTEEE